MSASNVKWVRLGDYIEESTQRVNNDTSIAISGINIERGFIPTVANLISVDTSKYKLVAHKYFACNLMHIGRDETIPIAYNNSLKTIAVSPAYYVFTTKTKEIIPQYLEMILTRREFGRLSWFHTDGSIRGNLPESTFLEIKIPLPSIEIQQELVNIYNGLKALAEQNEALIEPLSKACEAFIVDCKKKYPIVELGEYIEEYDKRNSDNAIKLVKSVSVTKEFKETNAKVNRNELSVYKIVPPNHIAYVQTTKNEKCFANALNTSSDTYVVSQVDKVIYSKNNNILNIAYLHLLFRSKEFDRYAIFNSWGSARETFDWEELCRVKIALPPIDVQQSIVNLYNCLEEAKKIASEAREKLKTLCPALVQIATNS
jgi:type I restriction enzyme S subunit